MIDNNLPNSSRVWIYQSDVKFTADQILLVEVRLKEFVDSWAAHGTDLNAAAQIIHNQFIVFFVDEQAQQATGCSIDKSVALIKSLQSETGLDLMNRMNISFRDPETIEVARMMDFQALIKEGKVTADTTVYNNLVQTKGEFVSSWQGPLKDSWHAQMLN